MDWEQLGWGPESCSDWYRCIRVLAYILRFVGNAGGSGRLRKGGALSVDEVRDAEAVLVRGMQARHYADELKAVGAGRPVAAHSKIAKMCPILDSDGVLRGNSRLGLLDKVAWETKFPVLLARHAAETRLIITRMHEDCQHGGTNHVLARLSARYWLPGAREEIREAEHACAECKLRKAKPASQVMAPLMPKRATMSLKAFTNTSVDYAGPFLTKQGRGKTRHKRYLCLFTCMSTRALHLEMAYALDTSSFMNAFYRMVSRRGLPKTMTSDNGTNFVGADGELKELVAALDQDRIQNSTVNQGIKWCFNTPAAPHHNGVHEVMVRAAKRAMHHVLHQADLSDEELTSAIVGAEGLLNSRPITYRGAHPGDSEPLTPNHFLFNQVGGEFAPESVDEEDYQPRKRWRRVQEVVHHFWQRWLSEWLPGLGARTKWAKQRRDIVVGELVLLLSPDTPRGKWPLGRVRQVFTGPDGHVRSAEVEVSGTLLKRPIVKLCPLECEA